MIKVFRVDIKDDYAPIWEVPVKTWKFPGGEVGVQLEFLPGINNPETEGYVIYWSFESNEEFFIAANIKDAIENESGLGVSLILPYVPYARQDRVCNSGESFALRVFAQMLNAVKFAEILCYDVHSKASQVLIENLTVVEQSICSADLPKYDYVIAPDAGAATKIYAMRQVNDIQNPTKVIVMEKQRKDGKVVHKLPDDLPDLSEAKICVVDDICDGGATFLSICDTLASVLNDNKPDLYVTHGIFSKGTSVLKEKYGTIYTSHLMNQSVASDVVQLIKPIPR